MGRSSPPTSLQRRDARPCRCRRSAGVVRRSTGLAGLTTTAMASRATVCCTGSKPFGARRGDLLPAHRPGGVGQRDRAVDQGGDAGARPAPGHGDAHLGVRGHVGFGPGQGQVHQGVGADVLDRDHPGGRSTLRVRGLRSRSLTRPLPRGRVIARGRAADQAEDGQHQRGRGPAAGTAKSADGSHGRLAAVSAKSRPAVKEAPTGASGQEAHASEQVVQRLPLQHLPSVGGAGQGLPGVLAAVLVEPVDQGDAALGDLQPR